MLSREYPNLYIDGRWQEPDSDERFDVLSPATGEKIGYVPAASTTDVDRAVAAARKAFDETDWASRPVEERAEMCERLATLISERKEEFRDLIVDELGHTKLTAEVYHSVAPTLHWNYYAQLGRNFKFTEVREADLSPLAGDEGGLIMKYETKSLVVREPIGVVAVLCAFNFPLPGIAQKTAPALVAGCTAVVKVPEADPLAIFAMAELVSEAGFPPGVLNIIAAGPRVIGVPRQPRGRRHGLVHRLHRGRQEDRRRLRRSRSSPTCSSWAASRPRSSSTTPTSRRSCRR